MERSSDRGRGDNRQLIAIAVGIPGRTIPGSQQSSGVCSGKLWEFAQQDICKKWYDMIWYDPQKKTYHPPPKKCISLRWVKAAWRAAALAEDSSASLVASPTCCRCQRSKCCGAPLGQVMGVIAGWVIMENPIKIDDLTHFRKPRGGILSWVITGLGTN